MWRVELVFRILIQTSMILLMYMCFGLNILLSILVSYALLYVPYSNTCALYKWISKGEPNLQKILQGLRRLVDVERKHRKCLSIYVVGSLAREPTSLFKKHVDIDARVVPSRGIKCLFTSLIVSLYLRTWSFLRKVPLDLYVKPVDDVEFREQSYSSCSTVYRKALEGV